MSNTAKADRIRYRLQQANDALREARVLYHESLFLGTVNRAYYAMYYAAAALMILRDAEISQPSGAIDFFERAFVKTGVFPGELSRSLQLAEDQRQQSDYGEDFRLDFTQVEAMIKDAESFVSSIQSYLDQHITYV